MGNRTPLYEAHLSLDAKIVDFGGWDMPLHYGSQIEEHHAVRQDAGVFDVSHMGVVEITGADAKRCADRLFANDLSRLTRPGQAMYTAMLNHEGGVLDDLIVYDNGDALLLVVNCANADADLRWMSSVAEEFDAQVQSRPEFAILAVQGPNAITKVAGLLTDEQRGAVAELKPFQGAWAGGWFIARTGYTGEKGYEIILPADEAHPLFDGLIEAGARPIGLGARDTLRLEAGMNLHGNDMNANVTPLESNMAGTVVMKERDFIGKDALEAQAARGHPALVGLVMQAKGVLRAHYPVTRGGEQIGETTSGVFSPTLQYSIALARVPGDVRANDDLGVIIRGKEQPVRVVDPPFVRNGKKVHA